MLMWSSSSLGTDLICPHSLRAGPVSPLPSLLWMIPGELQRDLGLEELLLQGWCGSLPSGGARSLSQALGLLELSCPIQHWIKGRGGGAFSPAPWSLPVLAKGFWPLQGVGLALAGWRSPALSPLTLTFCAVNDVYVITQKCSCSGLQMGA